MWTPVRRRQPAPSRLARNRVHTPQQARALRAAGAMLDLSGRGTATRFVTGVRQPWQAQALEYRTTVGELRYATRYQGNAARKTIFLPAVYMPGETAPVPIEDSDVARYADVAREALDRLGDVGARGVLARHTMENLKVSGECFLVGRTDRGEGVEREVWEIRSVSEIGVKEERPFIRETPGARDGIPLGPDDFLARMWTPDLEYRQLADSPVRVAIETCLEELVLLSRDIRAAAASRIALNGIFVYPDSWSIERADGLSADSGEDDPLMSLMIEVGTEAIRDPGSAAAAMPILMRAPADTADKGHHYTFTRPEADNAGKRTEALARLYATIDLPPEVVKGLSVGNHWTSWEISRSTWQDHLEPDVQDIAEAWTAAYYRRYLAEADVPPDVVARCLVWYDPVNVVTKPDKTQAAGEAHERVEISGAAYREHLGFRDDEAPDEQELLRRAALKGLLDPAATLAILQGREPPEPMATAEPMPPAVDAEPVDDAPADGPPNGGVPPDQPEPEPLPDAAAMRRRIEAATRRLAIAPRRALVAAGTVGQDEAVAISQRLATWDTQLRNRVRDACEAAVKRALEKAGARLNSKAKAGRDAAVIAAISDVPIWAVPYRLGPLTAAFGLDESGLLASVLEELEALWHRYVEAGSNQALRQAARLVGMDVNEAFGVLDGRFRADRAAGWLFLRDRLAEVAAAALITDPAEAIAAGSLVSPSAARAALAIAGGFDTPVSRGIDTRTLLPVDPREHFGGIGTGTTLKGFMEERGARVERYQWIYGLTDPDREFKPHLAIDREYFDSWDDDKLRSPEGAEFVGTHMRPGDHRGCQCDMILVWTPPVREESP